MEIEERVAGILANIESAASESGRSGKDITLVAATKMNDAAAIQRAIKSGVKVCGENRVQEFLEKEPQGAYVGAEIHFIGHLQRNKAKSVVGKVSLIESVGSIELAQSISFLAVKQHICQDVLVEVNIGSEVAKTGIEPTELDKFMEEITLLPGVRVCGLMAIPPAGLEEKENRSFFSAMHELFVDIKGKKYDNTFVQFLSMGMSADYMDAIREGANMVRIGTGIFGPRNY